MLIFSLRYDEINFIEEFSFSGLENLQFLGLDNNFIINVEENTVSGLKIFFVLRIRFNSMETLSVRQFENFLGYLNLGYSLLQFINRNEFEVRHIQRFSTISKA